MNSSIAAKIGSDTTRLLRASVMKRMPICIATSRHNFPRKI
jgi:hypothetical protein